MRGILGNKSFTWWQITLLSMMIFSPLFSMSLNSDLGADSTGYIDRQLCRPPLYPIFIWAFHIFGNQQLIVARWAQTIFTFVSLLYAGRWIQVNLEMPRLLSFLILLSVTMVISLYTHTLELIFSEGIAFPIFIYTFLLFVETCNKLETKKLAGVTLGISLLILTRHQFYYLYPVAITCLAWHLWKKESRKKILANLMIIILFTFTTAVLTQVYYHAIGKERGPSSNASDWQYTGWKVLVQPIYLADLTATKYFTNPAEKTLFLAILQHLEKDQYTRNSASSLRDINNLRAAEYHYISNLGRLQDSLRRAIEQNTPSGKSVNEVDSLLSHMSKILFMHSFKENISFYILRVTHYSGGLWIFLSSLLVLFLIFYRIVTDRDWRPTIEQLFIMISILFIFVNAAVVAVVESDTPRFFYYSIFLYFCLFGLLAKKFYKNPALYPAP
ncbi:MAG: hypothetical protein A3F11_02970 [Gammaproteobacteria bacterium RIFCSPHIGHO2_12_FULL_37_14]|nr:MAG: hypothetical protein A3F11_02970 [Gammaproteobacteria bacterium RIFCSPHIGHO2_12_FULL_37_14]